LQVGVAEAHLRARACRDSVVPAMQVLRQTSDTLEMMVDASVWPLPTYAEMLFVK
jgi:glutamine synthetase